MRKFLEFFKSHLMTESRDGWQMFMGAFHNMGDTSHLAALSDWIEEQGFPETAEFIRVKVSMQGHGYWSKMQRELGQHGMTLNSNHTMSLIPGNRTSAGRLDLKLTHNAVLMISNNHWVPVDKPYPEAVPGLSVLMVSKIYKTANTHDERINLSFLGQYQTELMNMATRLDKLVDRGVELTPRFLRELMPLLGNVENLLKKFHDQRLKDSDAFRISLNSIEHYVSNIHDMLVRDGRPEKETRPLVSFLARIHHIQ